MDNKPVLPQSLPIWSQTGWELFDVTKGRVVSSGYGSLDCCTEGVHVASKNNMCGLLSPDGATVLPFTYKYLSSVQSGVMLATLDTMQDVFLDKAGRQIVCSSKCDEYIYFGYGYGVCRFGETLGAIDINGDVVLAADYRDVMPSKDGIFSVVGSDLNHYHVLPGGKRITKGKALAVGLFREGLAYVLNEKREYYYIDKNGCIVHGPYSDVQNWFVNGYSVVRKQDLWQLIDIHGNVLNELSADYARWTGEVVVARKNNREYVYDLLMKEVCWFPMPVVVEFYFDTSMMYFEYKTNATRTVRSYHSGCGRLLLRTEIPSED